MSSFYGGASIYGAGNGSGGTSDYNDLQNVPVKNLVGAESNPIILSQLQEGNYILTGFYKFTETDSEINRINRTEISVANDIVTDEKIITYFYMSNGKPYIKAITYQEDNTYSISDISLANGSAPLFFIDDEEATAPAGTAPVITID